MIVVLPTGAGPDGTDRPVEEMGGAVIVQNPDGAQRTGMPAAAIRAGAVDYVVPRGDRALLPRLVRGREPAAFHHERSAS